MSSCVTGEGCVAAAPLEKTRTTPRVASANERPAPDGKDESRCLVIAGPTITLSSSSRSQSETAPTRSQYIRISQMENVRFGSKADICSAQRHVRFTPESDIDLRFSGCLLWANDGHVQI